MRLSAAALALLLAACGAPPAEVAAPQAAHGLTPDADGLQPTGTPLRIDFGRAQEGTVDAVSRLLGAAPASSMRTPGCRGADSEVSWPTGLTLAFRGGSFVGWRDAGGGTAGTTCGAA